MRLHAIFTALLTLQACFFGVSAQSDPAKRMPVMPSPEKNYIITYTPQIESIRDSTGFAGKNIRELSQSIQYMDGLGRSLQDIQVMQTPGYSDLVLPKSHDEFGREKITYLPYSDSSAVGHFRWDAIVSEQNTYNGSDQHRFYQHAKMVEHDPAPYSEVLFDASPLNRVRKNGSAGQVWQPNPDESMDRSVKTSYLVNEDSDVLMFNYNAQNGEITISDSLYYASRQLIIVKTSDEHDNEVFVYTDKEGKIVLKKVLHKADGASKLYTETYYVYDNFGNLIVVLPPEAVEKIHNMFVDE